jgi:hypothetical protein
VDAEPPRRNRDSARVIAGRECNDAAHPLFRRKLEQSVRRAAQFERAARLQALAFEPNAGASNLAFDERRSLHLTSKARRGTENIFTIDQRRFR